ncbi:hypothetical protein AGMMS49992_20910 [Clostridia bacterium]|nr:hypothetical protein AGMMS49992_20910 [Clostridia bacterium]
MFNDSCIHALSQLGFTIHLAANFDEDGSGGQNTRYVEACIENGYVVHSLGFQRASIKKNVKHIQKFKEWLATQSFDLIHAHTETGGTILRLAGGSLRKTKKVFTPHGMSFWRGCSLKRQMVYQPIERWIASAMDVNVAINEEEYTYFKKWNNRTARLIRGAGLDFRRFDRPILSRNEIRRELGIPESSMLVIAVGELNENKNHITLIRAVADMKDPNVWLIICGTGSLRSYLQDESNKFVIPSHLILAGYQSNISDMLYASDLFVSLSYHEGLPVSLLEAMRVGLPVIVSRVRGHVDLIQDGVGGYLCSPNDISRVSTLIKQLIREPRLRQQFGSINRSRTEIYEIGKVVDELKDIYCL